MNYYFFIGWKESDFLKYARKNYNYERDSLGDGLCIEVVHSGNCYGYAVWTRKGADIATLAHEIIHAANFALERRGIDIRDSDGETLAYYVEYLMRKARQKGN